MKAIVAGWRLLAAVGFGLRGLAIIRFRFPHLDAAAREAQVQRWARQMLGALGIALEVHGTPAAAGPVLLVANHISWLDILVMHASRYCRFVSKSDVKHWPVLGTLATGAGTLYIERESRRDALRVVHRMTESLRAGDVLAVFPEGTTSDGVALLPFHGNLLQAAISAGVPAQPVALTFIDRATREVTLSPCYVGDDTLLGSVWKTLTGPPVTAVVTFGCLRTPDGMDRRTWAEQLRTDVASLRQRP